ncbi:MAG: hypothetical protein O3B01_17410 [Planctomycetota bacterium]|nr:hypothetical protein [Planctomycetota bacterium]MDA1140353.1 hypothetical protein [Planctomycetota bacterium]
MQRAEDGRLFMDITDPYIGIESSCTATNRSPEREIRITLDRPMKLVPGKDGASMEDRTLVFTTQDAVVDEAEIDVL